MKRVYYDNQKVSVLMYRVRVLTLALIFTRLNMLTHFFPDAPFL